MALMWMVLLASVASALVMSATVRALLPSTGALHQAVGGIPYVLYILVALLGARMNQWQILFSAALFAGTYFAGTWIAHPLTFRTYGLIRCLAIALPVSLIAVLQISPRKLIGKNGLTYLLASLLPFAILMLLWLYGGSFLRSKLLIMHISKLSSLRFSILGPALLIPLGVTGLFQPDRAIREYHWAVVLALMPVFFLLNRALVPVPVAVGSGPWQHTAAFTHTMIGILLLYAVYRIYWSKAYLDELTGLPNRRALDEKLKSLSGTYAIAMADIDHFKRFNDEYGHEQGDHVLRYVATHLAEVTGGRAYRYGGEEFCIVCENMAEEKIRAMIEGVRASVCEREFYIRAITDTKPRRAYRIRPKKESSGSGRNARVRITISLGLDRSRDPRGNPKDVIQSADQLLYKAKEKGRNRVVEGF